MSFWQLYGEAAKTAFGVFWKSGWAFVLVYWVSAMIQAFVPNSRLTPYMGKANLSSVSIATLFGTASLHVRRFSVKWLYFFYQPRIDTDQHGLYLCKSLQVSIFCLL
jgi:hypothetical protein